MALVGELATHSDDFRTWWGGHTLRTHTSGTKRINHPLVGELTLGYETLALPSTPGLSVGTYLPEPGSPSADALDMLRSWIATPSTAPSTGALSGVEAPNP
jgi:MmyB-like transcription regulator ligand binding domain